MGNVVATESETWHTRRKRERRIGHMRAFDRLTVARAMFIAGLNDLESDDAFRPVIEFQLVLLDRLRERLEQD